MIFLWLAAALASRCPAADFFQPGETIGIAPIPASFRAAELAPGASFAPIAPLAQASIAPAPQQAPAPVAPDFGAKNGTEIANKATILGEIDKALGQDKPPSLEFLFVRPLSLAKVAGIGLGTNPYGHAAVRYTLPDGTQKAMNIVGLKGREMVNFLKPEDYLFGTRVFDGPSEQGGLYNRGMFSVRVERLPDEQVLALDRYYEELKARAERGEAGFSLALSDALNFLAKLTPGIHAERGNCARWCSMGLSAGGILKSATLWPKKIWTTLFKKWSRQDPSNIHVVAYRRVKHAARTYGADVDAHGLVAPFHWWADRRYWDLENYADAIVEVPAGAMTAKVSTRTPAWRKK